MKRIRLIEGDELDKYYERLCTTLEYAQMWQSLQSKAEVGSDRSEKGYQVIAKSMSGRIARSLGYNGNKAEVISMCVGSYFPQYGMEGKRIIEKYISQKGLDIEPSTLAIDCIEHSISVDDAVAVDLDEALKAYFANDNTIPEVEIVRISQNTIDAVKKIESLSNVNGGDLLYKVSEDIIEQSREKGRPTPSDKLNEMLKSLPEQERTKLTDEDIRQMVKVLNQYVNDFGREGVYEYINSDGRI